MAEKPKMSFLNIGKDKFEIVDEKAREDIAELQDDVSELGEAVLQKANLTYVNGMKLTKVWENAHPDQSMGGYPQPTADLGDAEDFVIEYRRKASISDTVFKHFHFRDFGVNSVGFLEEISYSNNVVTLYSRGFSAEKVDSGGVYHTELRFDDCDYVDGSSTTTDNTRLIPVRIYQVGDIYAED